MTINKKRGKAAAQGAVRYLTITTTATSEDLPAGMYEVDFVTVTPKAAAGAASCPAADWTTTRGTIALTNLVNGQVYSVKVEGKL